MYISIPLLLQACLTSMRFEEIEILVSMFFYDPFFEKLLAILKYEDEIDASLYGNYLFYICISYANYNIILNK